MFDGFDSDKKKFLIAFRKHRALITTAALEVGMSRMTYYNWCKADPAFAEAAEEIKEGVGDFVESKLFKNIDDGDPGSIRFYCQTQLRNRGYISKQEVEMSGSLSLNLTEDQLTEAARQQLEG